MKIIYLAKLFHLLINDKVKNFQDLFIKIIFKVNKIILLKFNLLLLIYLKEMKNIYFYHIFILIFFAFLLIHILKVSNF